MILAVLLPPEPGGGAVSLFCDWGLDGGQQDSSFSALSGCLAMASPLTRESRPMVLAALLPSGPGGDTVSLFGPGGLDGGKLGFS